MPVLRSILALAISFAFLPVLSQAASSSASSVCSPYPAPSHNTTYPSKNAICNVFAPLASNFSDATPFLSHVSPDVQWTIEGTHPLAGTYPSRALFANVLERVTKTQDPADPWKLDVINIVGGGDEPWSTVELHIFGPCKSGTSDAVAGIAIAKQTNVWVTGLQFDNRYAWVLRWSKEFQVVEARAYLDSTLVLEAIAQNEIGSRFTYSDIRTENVPYTSLTKAQLKNATGLQVQG